MFNFRETTNTTAKPDDFKYGPLGLFFNISKCERNSKQKMDCDFLEECHINSDLNLLIGDLV